MKRLKALGALAVLALTVSVSRAQTNNTKLTAHELLIDNMLSQMTLEEKVGMLHGKNMFSSAGVPRLGIADMEYADGPFGIREEMEPHSWNSAHLTTDSATFFPTGSALAATWSTEWAYAYGRGLSREARLRGKDMILGPAINIQRIPTGGRTYEYLSEDPLLSGMLAVAYTRGAQDDGTAVCLKHYALNNQEDYRGFVDVNISDRAMHEIYLRPFEMAVREGDAWGVMAAYNKVNGRWCSENEHLLTTVLRQQWGFAGMVISDWGGVHSTVGAVKAGLNVEMPGSRFMGQALLDSVKAGKVSEDVINQRVREILRVRLTVKPIPHEQANTTPVGNDAEMLTALQVARRSIVLLKNKPVAGKHALKAAKNQPWPLLPINLTEVKSIAVVGENAVTAMSLGGVGAGVKTRKEITPLDGLKTLLGTKKITYARGYRSFDRDSRNKRLDPQQPADPALVAEAVKAAKDADLVIYFAGDNREVETEGSDRKTITLPSGQDELARALAQANPRMVTVLVAGGPVDVSTVDSVSCALLVSWFNGSMGGLAIAEVLAGEVTPSGKLPMTWPKKLDDVPAYATGSYPQNAVNGNQGDVFVDLTRNRSRRSQQQLVADYAEQGLVGYRWYDRRHVATAYPFGHGLSYATFAYSSLNVTPTADGFDVSFMLTNNSGFEAEEVAQVYVSRPSSAIERPVKELKGFSRVALKRGESRKVTIAIRRADLAHWDEATQSWMQEPGDITFLVGGSSAQLPLSQTTTLPQAGRAQRGLRVRQDVPTDSIRLSDPAVLADKLTGKYYMTGTGGMMWRSEDLKLWEGPFRVTEFKADSWMGSHPMIWAAELHQTGDGWYYYFATFTNQAVKIDTVRGNVIERRASQVLRADSPMGPYRAFGDDTYLPAGRPTLDGTFWRDTDGKPYLVFCGEWLQNWNGTVEKIELKPDLSGTVGEPKVLFRASDSPWSREKNDKGRSSESRQARLDGRVVTELDEVKGRSSESRQARLDGRVVTELDEVKGEVTWNKVTDGPWLFRTGTGRLGMLWTSWVYDVYTQGVAYSESGTLDGPWKQEKEPITPPGFGHSMLFQRFDGQWMMSVHHHSKDARGRTVRIPHFFDVDLSGDKLMVIVP